MRYPKCRNSNKDRLYITLQHRMDERDYHWALDLVPKAEATTPQWRFEDQPGSPRTDGTLLSRFLVAKFPKDVPLETRAAQIRDIIKNIPPRQGSRRPWAKEALEALRAAGGDFGTIPPVKNGGQTELVIKETGDKAMTKFLEGKLRIESVADMPQKDIRVKGKK